MTQQIRQQIRLKMKMFDDVFHAAIIALERLERLISGEKYTTTLSLTAILTERDLHDDDKNIPTKRLLYGEMQLQCSTVFYQTRFDDEKMFHQTVTYFLEDLLKWYGGRPLDIPFDDVDKFFIPLMSALDRQVQDVDQLMQTVKKYVGDIDNDLSRYTEDEKEKAVLDGFGSYLRAVTLAGERYQQFMESDEELVLTVHERGSITEGLERLYQAFLQLYEEKTPVLFLDGIRKKYLSKIDFDPLPLVLNVLQQKNNTYETR